MATTVNISRTTQVENGPVVSGATTVEVQAVITLDQIISAGTEEQTAMAAFFDRQMESLALICDQVSTVQFLGDRFAILATVAGPPGTITHTGDLEQEIFPGDLVRVEGTVADDGVYLVLTVVFAAGDTTITLEGGQNIPVGAGAVGTVARVCSHLYGEYAFDVLAIVAATGAITFTGDLTDEFAAGDFLCITGSGVANDGFWEISSVTEAAGITTIVILDSAGAVGAGANEGAVAVFHKCAASFALEANAPIGWDNKNTCVVNPFTMPVSIGAPQVPPLWEAFRGRVAYCMIDVPGATNGQFDGRIGLKPDLL